MFFPGGTNGPGVVLNALVYAVTSGEGIVKVVGEVGSGKTMLCRMLEERLPDSVEIVYLANPSLSARDIIYAIAFELDLDVDASTERLLVMHKLQDYLVKKHSEGGSVVVFIEEAQGMPIETLEEIRLLSNLETHRHKLMQIILFGQPELDKNLQGKSIRQLRERITHSFYLEPMTLEQISDYLHYRMQAAGCPWPKVFTAKAEKLLSKASEGLTRRANILADKSLMAAYASSSIQPGHQYGAVQQKILPVHVKAAIRDSGYGKRHLVPWAGVFSSIGIVALVVVFYIGFSNYQATLPVPGISGRSGTEESAVLSLNSGTTAESINSSSEDTANISVIDDVADANNIQAETEVSNFPETDSEQVTSDEAAPELVVAELAIAETSQETLQTEVSPDLATDDAFPMEIVQRQDTATEADSLDEVFAASSFGDETSVNSAMAEAIPINMEAPDLNEIKEPTEAPELQSVQDVLVQAPEVSAFSGLQGLTGSRARASSGWLKSIAERNSYTVQMASFPVSDQLMLEEFLQLLSLTALLDETYLCLISETSRRPAQWLVIHGDFSGVSRARDYIASLPAYSRQYEPYVRNSSGIACLSETDEDAFLAF